MVTRNDIVVRVLLFSILSVPPHGIILGIYWPGRKMDPEIQ